MVDPTGLVRLLVPHLEAEVTIAPACAPDLVLRRSPAPHGQDAIVPGSLTGLACSGTKEGLHRYASISLTLLLGRGARPAAFQRRDLLGSLGGQSVGCNLNNARSEPFGNAPCQGAVRQRVVHRPAPNVSGNCHK
jgi:hypothetical protein